MIRQTLPPKADDYDFFDFDSHSPNEHSIRASTREQSSLLPNWSTDPPIDAPPSPPLDAMDWKSGGLFNNSNPRNPIFSPYGQITPPHSDQKIDSNPNPYHSQLAEANIENISLVSASTGTAPSSESMTKPTKKQKRSSKSSARTTDVKRSKFLERNRVAASKCRQKKKQWTSNLEDKARELQNNRSALQLMIDSLREELNWLKGQCKQHQECHGDMGGTTSFSCAPVYSNSKKQEIDPDAENVARSSISEMNSNIEEMVKQNLLAQSVQPNSASDVQSFENLLAHMRNQGEVNLEK